LGQLIAKTGDEDLQLPRVKHRSKSHTEQREKPR
jgi:hypothetical protein